VATILVVDDEEAIRNILSRILASAGHRMIEAADAEAALEALDREKPDLAFVDLIMPGKGGLSLIMESLYKVPNLAIVAMSGRIPLQGESLSGFSHQFGITCYLEKPFTPETVREAVRKALVGSCA